MSFLLDTCVISEFVSAHPDERVVRWIQSIDQRSTYLSVVTIGEIQRGIEGTQNLKRKDLLRDWLERDLLVRFRDQILTLDIDVLLSWGKLTNRLHQVGKPMPAMDSLIAATASHHGLAVVTRDINDFKHAEVGIVNPWSFGQK